MKDKRPVEKVCSRCKCLKLQDDFETITDSKSGIKDLYSMCKNCKNERKKEKDKIKREMIDSSKVSYTINIFKKDFGPFPLKTRKRCPKCELEKDLNDFGTSFNKKRNKIQVQGWCKKCSDNRKNEKRFIARRDDKGEILLIHTLKTIAAVRRDFRRKAKVGDIDFDYGFITKEWYLDTLKLQEEKCRICNKTVTELNRKLFVDHCHTTGKVRGLLCHICNAGLGHFRDSEEIMLNAIKYLKENG